MKILEPGKIPAEFVYTARCSNCNALVEFKQSEGNVTYDQRDGDFVQIACPTPLCGRYLTANLHAGKR